MLLAPLKFFFQEQSYSSLHSGRSLACDHVRGDIVDPSSFAATMSALDEETSALDVETSALGAAMSVIARRSFDATISALDAETSALGVATSAISRSYRQYRRGVSCNIGNCGVGITSQMCNRVTNHGDMSTFSKPACGGVADLCGVIADFCGVIADPCGVVAIHEAIGGRRCSLLRNSLNIIKHC